MLEGSVIYKTFSDAALLRNLKTERFNCCQHRPVTQWFKNLPNKCDSAFISFDVVEFYPSITEDLLVRALDLASNYVTISVADRHVIMHTKQSLLFSNETPWQKKNSNTLFDVTMGSFDGAETCELVGCYLLS